MEIAVTHNQAMYEGRAAATRGDREVAKAHFFAAVQLAGTHHEMEEALASANVAGANQKQLAVGAVQRSAEISDCKEYRYSLTRCWDKRLPMIRWVMLNPSMASAEIDDPTVRKCVGFARRWGFGRILIHNLFALRSTDPRNLFLATIDPVGPVNGKYLAAELGCPTVAAWGGNLPKLQVADEAVAKASALASNTSEDASWWCLGSTKGGEPRHPLMLSYRTEREPWPRKAPP